MARQVAAPVIYKGLRVDGGFRMDMVVEDRVIVELKAVEVLLPVHSAQLLTYLKLTGRPLGLLINFNVPLDQARYPPPYPPHLTFASPRLGVHS